MISDPHGAEFRDQPVRLARIIFLTVACLGFVLFGTAQADALDAPVSTASEPIEEVAEPVEEVAEPVEEVAESVEEVEEAPPTPNTETVTEATATESVEKVADPFEKVQDAAPAESTEPVTQVAATAPAEVEDSTTVTEPVESAEGTTPAVVKATQPIAETVADTSSEKVAAITETVSEVAVDAPEPLAEAGEAIGLAIEDVEDEATAATAISLTDLTDPTAALLESSDELVPLEELAEELNELRASLKDVTAEVGDVPAGTRLDQGTPTSTVAINDAHPPPNFAPGKMWAPPAAGNHTDRRQAANHRPVAGEEAGAVTVDGPPGADPVQLKHVSTPLPEPVLVAIARAVLTSSAAQSAVFLAAALLLMGPVAPRLADWLRLQPLIRRDRGFESAIELPG